MKNLTLDKFITKSILFVVIILFKFITSQTSLNNIISIDLGNDFIKASFYEQGKFLSMIENFQSHIKTSSALAFKGFERYYAADAIAKYTKNPELSFIKLNHFLGFNINNFIPNEIKEEEISSSFEYLKNTYRKNHNLLYEIYIDEERNSINFKLNLGKDKENTIYSIEEIYAMIFRYIQSFSSKFLGREINEFLVCIPSFFTHKQRTTLIQSLNIANIKVNHLISSGLSAGIFYALEKTFQNNDKNGYIYTIIFDMGSSYTQASLFSYNSYLKIENKKTIETINVRKIYETYDNSLGGKYFDIRLAELLAKKYSLSFPKKLQKMKQYSNWEYNDSNILIYDESKNIIQYLKKFSNITLDEKINMNLISKFLYPSQKIKEILSANKEYRFNLVIDNENFIGNITRQELEEYSQDLFERITAPIERILEVTNKDINEIESIQIIGGGLRVNKIKQILSEKYDYRNKKIFSNLNSDDSITLGGAYYYANKSIGNFVYKNKRIISQNKYPFNADFKIRVKNLIEDFSEQNINSDNLKGINLNKDIFCDEKLVKDEEIDKYYDCLMRVDEERSIFAKDLSRDNVKVLNFKNKINTNLIIEIYETFKENRFQRSINNQKDDVKNNGNSPKLDLIGTYKIVDIKNYLNSINKEIQNENTNTNFTDSNSYFSKDKLNITMNLIFSVDSLGITNLKAEFQYEVSYYLNYEKTKQGEFRFFYSSKFPQKINNKTLTEEFNYINKSLNFKAYSRNDKIALKKKLKYEIGTIKKEIKKREILLDYIPSEFPLPLTKKQITKSRVKLNSIDAYDEKKRIFGEKLNYLENLIYTKLDFFDNQEKKKYYSIQEENNIKFILNQIKDEIFNSNSDANPLYIMMNSKNSQNMSSFRSNGLNIQNNDNIGNIETIEEKIKLINELFSHIDSSIKIDTERNKALEEYQSLFNEITKEHNIMREYVRRRKKKNQEDFVDLNVKKPEDKELIKLALNFEENIYSKLKNFELELAKKLEEQVSRTLREEPYLIKEIIQKFNNEVSKLFDKHIAEKNIIENRNKKIAK